MGLVGVEGLEIGERATAERQGSESPYPPFLLEEFLFLGVGLRVLKGN